MSNAGEQTFRDTGTNSGFRGHFRESGSGSIQLYNNDTKMYVLVIYQTVVMQTQIVMVIFNIQFLVVITQSILKNLAEYGGI